MKRTLGYSRISKRDQSNFSIPGQNDAITGFCKTNSWELKDIFVDNGRSAKNFDRPDWKKLEEYLKKNAKDVDYLILMKYDRFSRNLLEALQKIELIEQKYNIKIISIMEPIGVHPDSPYFFKIRTTILTDAEMELRVIQDRTKFGINAGRKAGRHLNMAPTGYVNKKEKVGQKEIGYIEPCPIKSKIIQGIFARFLNGEAFTAILKWARGEGLMIKGKSTIRRILENPTYCGLVKVPKYYDQPEYYVPGIHKPLITQDEFYRVQNLIKNQSKPLVRTILNDNVPLRGKALCFCGRPLTAGRSKGKLKYVWYYKCHSHNEHNLNAVRLNTTMQQIFDHLSLPDRLIEPIKAAYERSLEENGHRVTKETSDCQKRLDQVRKLKNSMEEKYFDNQLDYEAYFKWKSSYTSEILKIEDRMAELKQTPETSPDIESLMNMGTIYHVASIENKQALVGVVFNNLLFYENKAWRTPFLLELFTPKAPLLKEKGLLYYEQSLCGTIKSPRSSESGTQIEHLTKFFKVIADIKAA